MAENSQQKFELRKVYTKDISFESPMAPLIFRSGTATPTVDVQLDVSHQDLGDDMYESLLTVTVRGKLEDDKHAFLAEVQQAGVYEISGVDPEKGLIAALEVACPSMLFPFARESVNDLVTRGGFPQLLLAPVSFESMYRQKLRNRRAAQDAPEEPHATGSDAAGAGDAPAGTDGDPKGTAG